MHDTAESTQPKIAVCIDPSACTDMKWETKQVMTMQGKSLPLSVFGLLQHETKLSVVNFSVRKSASFEEPLPNKAELLILTGVRCV